MGCREGVREMREGGREGEREGENWRWGEGKRRELVGQRIYTCIRPYFSKTLGLVCFSVWSFFALFFFTVCILCNVLCT